MRRGRFSSIFNRPVVWLASDSDQPFIVVSSRVRLARNLAAFPFPVRASQEQRQEILEKTVAAVLGNSETAGDVLAGDMNQFGDLEKQLLLERRLISRELCRLGAGSGILLNREELLAIMINEEDHLRIQGIAPGFQLPVAHQLVDRIDTILNQSLEFAFRPDLGFLTACPSNVGTGMRGSVMLHLPGLVLSMQIEPVIRAAGLLHCTVRGLFGEGSGAVGNFFQISNQATLGESEEAILARLDRIIQKVVQAETLFRQRLLKQRRNHLYDQIGRAYGILRYARVLPSKDALNQLSLLLLGCDLGLFSILRRRTIHELMILIQPGHLQKAARKMLSNEERDIFRANLVRNFLEKAAQTRAGSS